MKLVCIADTHGRHRDVDLPKGDVLIHAGDISVHGERQAFEDFNKWIYDLGFDIVLFTMGNHDRCRATMIQKLVPNGLMLNDTDWKYMGLKFYGSPQTPSVWDTKEEYCYIRHDYEDAQKIWDKIPDDTDVLITHGPPLGILDFVDKKNAEVGCSVLLDRVLEVKPKVHIFGHIHESNGYINQRYGIKFVNCAQMDGEFSMTNKPIVVEI